MTKRANAKYKIDRRMGENIWGRPKSPVNKREYGPGQHGQRRKGKMSDFGTQLKAKQKLKGYYANLSERQFRKVYEEATRMTGDASENLIGLLERRLDMVIYRAKFVSTVFAARQFVSHGHVKVRDTPDYIEVDHKGMTARMVRIPALSDVPYPVQMQPNLVVEYYSR